MKKILLSALASAMALTSFSQAVPHYKLAPQHRTQAVLTQYQLEVNSNPGQALQSETPAQSRQISATETEIGDTRYDLQSNAAVQRRIINHTNGTISAAWTFSSSNSWTTRGTGYNYFNGSAWGTAPTSEIETERTGWPSLLATASGKEVIISHSTASSVLRQSDRGSIGSGTWTQANVTSLNSQVWNRAATNGNTIHCISMTLPVALNGQITNAQDGSFLYNRSSNGGVSWDIANFQIPGTDSAYYDGFGGDAQAIDAAGDTIAIVVGEIGRGVQLYKSTDNGITWTHKEVMHSDVWFDEPNTFIDTADRLYTTDGNVSVLLDHQGNAHVWYARMYIANDDLTDGSFSYYPGTNGIDYWNESFPEDGAVYLTGALDIDGNGQLDLIGTVLDAVGRYVNGGLSGQPQAGIDAEGCIYLTYQAIREDLDNGAQHYRHTYAMRSCDNGCTWSFPIDVTGSSSNNFSECVFPTIARRVDSSIHVIYMSDNEPGMAVSGDQDNPGVNKIIYLNEDVDRFDTTDICPTGIMGDSNICNGGSAEITVLGCASAYSWSGPGGFTASTATITATALGLYTCTLTTSCGTQTESINIVEYTGSANPWVNLQATVNSMCPGGSSTITAYTNIGGLSYQWSANAASATTQSVTVSTPGTFTVTVTSCGGGETIESFTIDELQGDPPAVVVGDLSICPTETTMLTALPVIGGSYLWSTGSTAQSVTVSSAGTYTVTISNCGGSSTASVTVSEEDLPVAAIVANETEVCEGGQLSATASGGTGFAWSNGSTSAAITITQPSESGTFTVTVTNDCGDEDTEEVTLTIFETPSAPNVTFDGTNYVSSQTGAGTHQWFVGTTEITSSTGNTLPSNTSYAGKDITCIYTDENGCVSEASSAILTTGDIAGASGITVYPNPNNGRFEVRFGQASDQVTIEVTDILGKTVYSNQVAVTEGSIEVIDLSTFESGVYQLNVQGESISTVQSVVIK